MWEPQAEQLLGGTARRIRILQQEGPLRYSDAFLLWQADESFRDFFNTILAQAPFAAYRWETPPVTAATANRPFEFVLIETPGLERPPDPAAFSGQFEQARPGELVAAFANIGGDAFLVVPRPAGPVSAYGHLAAFARQAPPAQIHELWQTVGQSLAQRLSAQPVWLSTAGMGVPWLHVRLDRRPKYYAFREYRDVSVEIDCDTGELSWHGG